MGGDTFGCESGYGRVLLKKGIFLILLILILLGAILLSLGLLMILVDIGLTSGAVRDASVLGYHVSPLFSYYSYHGPVFRVMLLVNRGKLPENRHYGFISYCNQCGNSQTILWGDLGKICCPCSNGEACSGEAAAGTIAWDSEGKVIGAGIRKFKAKSAEEAEMVAAEVAIGLAIAFGWNEVYIEGDCSEVIKALNSQSCSWVYESLRDYVVQFSSVFEFCKFQWINRESNGEAHQLAQWAFHMQQREKLPFCILTNKITPVML